MIKQIPRIRTRVSNDEDDGLGDLGCLLVDGDRAYALGGMHHNPTLLVTDDGGHDWRRLTHPPVPGLRAMIRHEHALYLIGESGFLAVSVDSALTWTRLPIDTEACLFDIVRAPDGTFWIAGDDHVILRSSDGLAFEPVESDDSGRSLSVAIIDGVVHILGYDGRLRSWDGHAFRVVTVEDDTPLTDLLVTRAGTWLLTGDGGMVFRSVDRGATWAVVVLDTASDLEAIIESPKGVLIVGDDATLLFSDDDGVSFVEVPNELEGHLWSIAEFHGGYLVSGSGGAIWALDVSATETAAVEDEEEAEAEEEEAVPASFDSIEQASARWIAEGTAFAAALNGYVSRVYSVGPNKAGREPSETREDMAGYVRTQLIALNAAGDHARARQLFPPAYEPFDYEQLGQSIARLAYLRDGRRVACVAHEVFELQRDRIVAIPDVVGFAQSFDRKWVAKQYPDRIDIHDGWDGPLERSLPCSLDGIVQATVSLDGDALLIAADTGIFWLTQHGAQRLLPTEDSGSVSYPHAALSPNGRFVAMGTQDSPHIIVDRKTGRRHLFDPMSSYPHFAAFHHDRPEAVLSSCHALHGSGTQLVDLEATIHGTKSSTRPLDQRAWVYSIETTPTHYLLADRGGYIWSYGSSLEGDLEGEQQWYCFLGSTLTATALSPDRRTLLVGSFAGIICELSLTETSSDPRLLTNGPVRDLQRWLFWRGSPPLIW